MTDSALKKAMENAEASLNMEGLYVSEECKELCRKLLKKEISLEEYIECINPNRPL